ncbi:site-specific recombinase XerD [Paenibacillus mucilaginosus]|uniref:tyrosine-type recombinase/integrase n=1 Tax=Paenibacillus mucilaginosus TaxID=61624 RepID=UPI003D261E93
MSELQVTSVAPVFGASTVSAWTPGNLAALLSSDTHAGYLRDIVASSEDGDGNYAYGQLTNIAMIYLFVHHPAKPRRDKTRIEYLRELIAFLHYIEAIGYTDIRQLSRSDMERYQRYLDERYPKSTTRSKKVTLVHAFLAWCYEENYLTKDVTRGLVAVKVNREEIPEREIDESKLQAAIDFYAENPKVQSLLLIISTSGLRLNELLQPVWGDLYYDTAKQRYYLRTITKRGKKRHALIKDYAVEVLKEYRRRVGLPAELDLEDKSPFYPNRSGKHYRLSSLSTYLSKKMAAAGLKTIEGHRTTPHFLRHAFAQVAYANGASTDYISETLGHSDTRITKVNYLSRRIKKDHDVGEFVDFRPKGL